jgi:lysophospholipase L1-like esterase
MAMAEELPRSIGALGDSMTAGALANYRRAEANLPWNQVGVILQVLNYGLTRKMAAVEARRMSWSTGWRGERPVMSHAARLRYLSALEGVSFEAYNASLSGAESDDVRSEQLQELSQWSRTQLKQEYPDYVTLLVGANDICADQPQDMKNASHFHSNVEAIVDSVLARSPRSKVLISALPDIEKLRNVAKNASTLGGRCEGLWKTIQLCPTLTTLNDPTARKQVADRVREFNEVLSDVTSRGQERHGDRVRFAKDIHSIPFSPNDLALDCFHPSDVGQNKLADETWKHTWWSTQLSPRRKMDLKRRLDRRQSMPSRSKS